MGSLTDKSFKISKGDYIRMPRPLECPDRRFRYPWINLKDGDRIEEPFPWKALARVRMSLREWNRRNKTAITIDPFPNGSEKHPHPHFIVGWSKGDTWTPEFPNRVSIRPHKSPRSSTDSLEKIKDYLKGRGPTRATLISEELDIHASTVSKILRNADGEVVLGPDGWYLKPGKKGPQNAPKETSGHNA